MMKVLQMIILYILPGVFSSFLYAAQQIFPAELPPELQSCELPERLTDTKLLTMNLDVVEKQAIYYHVEAKKYATAAEEARQAKNDAQEKANHSFYIYNLLEAANRGSEYAKVLLHGIYLDIPAARDIFQKALFKPLSAHKTRVTESTGFEWLRERQKELQAQTQQQTKELEQWQQVHTPPTDRLAIKEQDVQIDSTPQLTHRKILGGTSLQSIELLATEPDENEELIRKISALDITENSKGFSQERFLELLKNLKKQYTEDSITAMVGYSGKNGKQDFERMMNFKSRCPAKEQWCMLEQALRKRSSSIQQILSPHSKKSD